MLRRTGLSFLFGALGAAAFVMCMSSLDALGVKEYKSGIVWPEPKVIEPGKDGSPPSDAIVLFDGKDLSKWRNGENWEIKDGYAITRKSDITTKESFGDCQLHVEFATPEKVESSGQGRGNSGVYLMGHYEVQILDSYNNKTYFDGQCGSLYKQTPPMVNACRKPGEWQSFDILFEAPRFNDDGTVKRPGYVTVLHNGVCVQNHFELQGGTFYDRPAKYEKHAEKLPMRLQFHGNAMKFRNIWVRDIKPLEGKKPEGSKN
jgi:3-keto-disaccharide hydrolase